MLAACIGAITWESDSNTFLKADEVEAAQNSITDLSTPFESVATSFANLNDDEELGFSYNGAFPIEDKANEVASSISSIGTTLNNLVKSIGNTGNAHRKGEAIKFYNEVKKHLIELNNNIQNAVTNYNSEVSRLKTSYISSCYYEGAPANYYSEVSAQADATYGFSISVSPAEPYTSSLATLVSIPADYKSNVDGNGLGAAIEEYNSCASTKGQEAERVLKDNDLSTGDFSSTTSTYDRVSFSEVGLSEDYVSEYNSTHSQAMDLHYYGTVQVTNPDGTTSTVPIYYDANEHNDTFNGGIGWTDASRLFTVDPNSGEICYLSNTNLIAANDDTSGNGEGIASSGMHYDISIPVNSDGTPRDEAGHYTVYSNHDNPSEPVSIFGGWSDTLYYKDSDGNDYTVDWSTVRRTTNDGFGGSEGGKF